MCVGVGSCWCVLPRKGRRASLSTRCDVTCVCVGSCWCILPRKGKRASLSTRKLWNTCGTMSIESPRNWRFWCHLVVLWHLSYISFTQCCTWRHLRRQGGCRALRARISQGGCRGVWPSGLEEAREGAARGSQGGRRAPRARGSQGGCMALRARISQGGCRVQGPQG